ncbi:RluA family pseudouridine synthase [Clostridium sp. UBA4548]|uniref:RluA family pseudouridine synthase n=1 Tax=Clostridium sp. UBA4548 TaxID=1946361 RepID=UPI0025C084B7|nr:RluA family pseudouridine synthase [Clostridium sp. UBA4548]
MGKSLTYEVTNEGDGVKIRDYMTEVLSFSGRFTRNAGMEKRIKVNGSIVKLNHKLHCGDTVTIEIEKEESQNIIPEDLNIEIVYEDADLLVANKRPFMVVHPTKSHPTGTLSNGVLYHFKENNEKCIVRLVSRLDMDTSGLIMIAKSQFAHMNLAKAMEENNIVKSYLALVQGEIEPKSGTIDLPIGRPDESSIKRVVCEEGQKSITHYKTIDTYKQGSLIDLTLETGRTHQIRVHLSHIGNPIYGDTLYGAEEGYSLINRQALHAYKLVIPHPRTGEILTVHSDLPEDMKRLIEVIK